MESWSWIAVNTLFIRDLLRCHLEVGKIQIAWSCFLMLLRPSGQRFLIHTRAKRILQYCTVFGFIALYEPYSFISVGNVIWYTCIFCSIDHSKYWAKSPYSSITFSGIQLHSKFNTCHLSNRLNLVVHILIAGNRERKWRSWRSLFWSIILWQTSAYSRLVKIIPIKTNL